MHGAPIVKRMGEKRGQDREGGKASNAPSIRHGITGTLVPATSIPKPRLKGPIEPVRVRVPSGKRTKPHGSSTSRRRSAAMSRGSQFFRHSGRAFIATAENAETGSDSKNVSPAASG